MARALVERQRQDRADDDVRPRRAARSLQLYGSDPAISARRSARSCDADRVDHIDLNFGCPAAKVTRKGGGAAVPVQAPPAAGHRARRGRAAPRRTACRSRSSSARASTTTCSPTSTTGRIAEDEGVAAIALHARTAEQHYAGDGRLERDRPS